MRFSEREAGTAGRYPCCYFRGDREIRSSIMGGRHATGVEGQVGPCSEMLCGKFGRWTGDWWRKCVVDTGAAESNYGISSTSLAASVAGCSNCSGGQRPDSNRSEQSAICKNTGRAIDSSSDRASLPKRHETDWKKGMCRILPRGRYDLLGRRWPMRSNRYS